MDESSELWPVKLVSSTYSRVVDGSACSKLSNTDSHLLGSIPADRQKRKRKKLLRML